MRIHIIGGPGSGKTYAAKRLAHALNMKCYDIDDIYWHKKDQDFTKKASEKERDLKVNKIAKLPCWIVEGAYTNDWVAPFVSRADIIVFITPHRILRAGRIMMRSLRRKSSKKRAESFFGLLDFIKWNHQYDARNLIRGKKLLKRLGKKANYFDTADKAIEYVIEQVKRAE